MYPILRKLVAEQIRNTWLNLSVSLPLHDYSSFNKVNLEYLHNVTLSGDPCTAYMMIKIGDPQCEDKALRFNTTLVQRARQENRVDDNIRKHYELNRWGYRYSTTNQIWYSNTMTEDECKVGCCDECFQTYCEVLENTKILYGDCNRYPTRSDYTSRKGNSGDIKERHRRGNWLHVYDYQCSADDTGDDDTFYANSKEQTCGAKSRELIKLSKDHMQNKMFTTYCIGGFSTSKLANEWCQTGDIKDPHDGKSALRNGEEPTKAYPSCWAQAGGCKYNQDYENSFNTYIGEFSAEDDHLYDFFTKHRNYRMWNQSDCRVEKLPGDFEFVTSGPQGQNNDEANKYFTAEKASNYFTNLFSTTLFDWNTFDHKDARWFQYTSRKAGNLVSPAEPHIVIIDADLGYGTTYNDNSYSDITKHPWYACQHMLDPNDVTYYQEVDRKRC